MSAFYGEKRPGEPTPDVARGGAARIPIYTTNDAPAGYRIERTLGLCWGITVRSRDVIGTTIAGLRTIVGGEINELSELAEHAREQALERLEMNARQMGANCVIAMRFDSTEIMQSTNEIIAYGTAVVVTPLPGEPRA